MLNNHIYFYFNHLVMKQAVRHLVKMATLILDYSSRKFGCLNYRYSPELDPEKNLKKAEFAITRKQNFHCIIIIIKLFKIVIYFWTLNENNKKNLFDSFKKLVLLKIVLNFKVTQQFVKAYLKCVELTFQFSCMFT